MIQAKVVADSINSARVRITTLVLDYPRFIHSELMTHRVFSRNAASSRAVPTSKMLDRVRNNPASFEFYGKNKAGMQATEEMSEEEAQYFDIWWRNLGKLVADDVQAFLQHSKEKFDSTPHKQMINRVLEPWLHMQTLVTATEWDNFFALRCHKDAQPEFRVLAEHIRDAMDASEPEELTSGEWHIPFIRDDEELDLETQLKVSTARCARTSYYHHDGKTSPIEKDIELHDRLVGSVPIHASPTEHQALNMGDDKFYKNFRGWEQYRATVEERIKTKEIL